MNVSVLILTHNEEVNIEDCLESVAWCDDVVVLDSGSTDRTLALARARGARILEHPFRDFASQRNHGIRHGAFRHDWIFHLDADERVPAALREELAQVTKQTDKDAFRVASKLMFQGRWLKHSGMFPVYQVRLGRREVLTFKQVGHGQQEDLPPGRIGTLTTALVHEAFAKGLPAWHARHARYAEEEAEEAVRSLRNGSFSWRALLSADCVQRRRAAKHLSWRLPARSLLRFVYMYLLRGGFLDGAAGLSYCRMLAGYERLTDARIRELKRR